MSRRRALGIYREREFSPGKVEADATILDAVLAELSSHGVETRATEAKAFVEDRGVQAEIILAMCQSESALRRLAEAEARGAVALNSALSIRNCYRDLMATGLVRAGVPTPDGVLVSTAPAPDLSAFGRLDLDAGVYVKRGDLHALGSDDVQRVQGGGALLAAIDSFGVRGVQAAYVQQAIAGRVVKFYGVGGGEFFTIVNDGDRDEVGEDVARELAAAAAIAASALGLEAWGGDAVLNGEDFTVIDFNDWPSYGRVREQAARAIGRRAMRLAVRRRQGS
jgi:glutathione synthase/RimK-type ligase-like ATP-grasp enzyme